MGLVGLKQPLTPKRRDGDRRRCDLTFVRESEWRLGSCPKEAEEHPSVT